MSNAALAPLRGCGTALVTPFTPEGAVDEAALRALVEWQVTEGVDFLVPCGSTGEAATLDTQEHLRVVAITAEVVAGRVPVIGGAASNDTKKAIALSKAVIEAGATHLLQVSPMYSRPPQRGIVAHFHAIADAVTRPVVLYNVPARTASNMDAATTLTLAVHPNIVAMKEASGNVPQIEEILRNRPDGFSVLSGDDAITLQLMSRGANGVISVVSNAAPRAMASLTRAHAQWRRHERPHHQHHACPALQGLGRRVQPHPGEGGHAPAGPRRQRAAPAAGAARRRTRGGGA